MYVSCTVCTINRTHMYHQIVKKRRAMRDDDTGSPCRNEEVLINSIQKRPIC